jgi:hypothetical protein
MSPDLVDVYRSYGFDTPNANGKLGASLTQLRLLTKVEEVTLSDFREDPRFERTTAVCNGIERVDGFRLVEGGRA